MFFFYSNVFYILQKTKKTESRSDSTAERMSCYGVSGDSLTCLISEQSLTLFEMLGNGAFGYVRRGKWVKSSLKKVLCFT